MAPHRRTIDDLRQAERVLNRTLATAGSAHRFLAQGRNGYQGIDRYQASDPADGDTDTGRATWAMMGTLVTAINSVEATLVLEAMTAAIDAVIDRD